MSARLARSGSGLFGRALLAIAVATLGADHAASASTTAGAGEDTSDVVPPEPLLPARSAPALAAPPSASALALAALDRRIADLDAEEIASKRDLGEIGAKIADAHARALSRGRAYYKLTRSGMLALGGGFDALVTHAMRVERVRRALAADLADERELRAHGADLARSLDRVAKDRQALATQRTSMDAARVAMEEEAQRREAFDRAFQTSTGSSEFVQVGGGGPDEGAGSGFGAARGKLLFPLLGPADVKQAHKDGIEGLALEMHTKLGTAVRTVYAGRVAFADRYGSYGRIVIVDHGEHYYTVSGNLASVDVRVGDEVSAGERLGTVGDEGQGPLLYFEIRHGSQTLPPSPWLGL